jgi:uncharacterized membrane protein (UPF0127 family)
MQTRRGTTLALALLACVACHPKGPVATIHTRATPVEILLEVAVTPAEQRRGLMFRQHLADDHGMLFVFPTSKEHIFWMKDTVIPLDMLFIAEDGRIAGIHAVATPLSTAPISIGVPSRYVIEVPGGYAARRGIAAGDRVDLPRIP